MIAVLFDKYRLGYILSSFGVKSIPIFDQNKIMKLRLLLCCLASSVLLKGQVLVSSSKISTSQASTLAFSLIFSGAPPSLTSDLIYDVDTYKLTYNTVDVNGNPTVASGALMVPKSVACDSLSLLLYAHGTVLEKENVPSRDNFEAIVGQSFASTGRIVACPDYLGLGDNPGLHPYLHAETEATASIDMMRAAREYVRDSLSVYLSGQVLLTGYSQGGHAAMATFKYIEDSSLTNEFNIIAAGPASGPYNLSGAMKDVMLSGLPYSNPGYLCYLLFGLNTVYGNIFNNYSDILKTPYEQIIPPYFNGTYPMDSVNAQLTPLITDFIEDSVLANFKADSIQKKHPIWQALLANDNFDWKPEAPLEMYYCIQDEQVSYFNALDAEAAMLANGADSVKAVFAGNLNHTACLIPALAAAHEFFKRKERSCIFIGIEEQRAQAVYLYPNPAHEFLYIEGIEEEAQLVFYQVNGAEVMRKQIKPHENISLEKLPLGLYIVQVISQKTVYKQKLLIK